MKETCPGGVPPRYNCSSWGCEDREPPTRLLWSRRKGVALPLGKGAHLARPHLPRAVPGRKHFCESGFASRKGRRPEFPRPTSPAARGGLDSFKKEPYKPTKQRPQAGRRLCDPGDSHEHEDIRVLRLLSQSVSGRPIRQAGNHEAVALSSGRESGTCSINNRFISSSCECHMHLCDKAGGRDNLRRGFLCLDFCNRQPSSSNIFSPALLVTHKPVPRRA